MAMDCTKKKKDEERESLHVVLAHPSIGDTTKDVQHVSISCTTRILACHRIIRKRVYPARWYTRYLCIHSGCTLCIIGGGVQQTQMHRGWHGMNVV